MGRLDNDIKKKLAELQEIQDSIDSLEAVRKEKTMREELEVLLNSEETMWAQKARSNWILNGDRNTRYFQTVVRQRRARSKILHIKDEEGLLLEDPLENENRLVTHFKSPYKDTALLSVDSILSELQSFDIPKLSHQQCLDMSRPVTSWEIEDTIFQLGPHKASGPNGIPAFFFVNSIGRLSKSMLSTPLKPFFIQDPFLSLLIRHSSPLFPNVPFLMKYHTLDPLVFAM